MNQTNPKAEQVGSLLRPAELLQAREDYAAGKIELARLREIEDRAIIEALGRQRRAGLDILTDGEMRRGSWLSGMADSVEGFVAQKVTVEWKGPGGGPEGSTAQAAGGRLRKLRKMTETELPLLKESAGGRFKITVPAPSNFLISSYKPGLTDAFYPTPADLLRDLAEIVRDEVEWLISQNVDYIQLDAPYYSVYLDPAQRSRIQSTGADPDAAFEAAVAADNSVFKNAQRDGVTFALHICRGNSRGRWIAEGGYDAIAERLFGSLDVDRFLLEYDSERAGGFEPLRLVPRGKDVVLGLITTKDPRLESVDDLRRRIEEALRYVPLEHLAIGPQCGFASVAEGNRLSMEDQWRKLERVAETARQVWG